MRDLYIYINMNIKENGKSSPIVIKHWKNKFDKSVRILLGNGYNIDDLIKKINEIILENNQVEK